MTSSYLFSHSTILNPFVMSAGKLICLPLVRDMELLEHPVRTAKTVLQRFRGKALLCDEVGLGKTIEAGLIFSELRMRGLVRSALVLGPLIVDEAHHLRNRNTQSWKLVSELRKQFVLLLTATPVQNNLEELFNLVTLLEPGLLRTAKQFSKEFIDRKDKLAQSPGLSGATAARSEATERGDGVHRGPRTGTADVGRPGQCASARIGRAPGSTNCPPETLYRRPARRTR